MIKINFIKNNKTITVDVPEGLTLMEAARDYAQLSEIPGDCGGACACATCHVWIDEKWFSKIEPIDRNSAEQDLLDYEDTFDPDRSRLGCQIILKKSHNNICVNVIDK